MARKIRFPLKMTNGTDVRTIEELRTNFDLTAILGYYADGKLVTWLRDRYHDAEADKIEALDKDSKSFQNDLCAALGVEAEISGNESDDELDLDYINRRNEKKRLLRDITDDEEIIYKVDQVAFDQDDLLDLFDEGKREIYLCQGKFEIPLSVTDVTYIGVADPIVTVRVTDNVNFKEKNIKFVDCVYGWDISGTSPLDDMKRAEHLFLKGDYQKAVSILKNYGEQGNPRAILLLCHIFEDFLPNKKELDYWEEKTNQCQEVNNVVYHFNDDDEFAVFFPLLKKLADKGDSFDLFNYAKVLYDENRDDELIKNYNLSAEKGNILAMAALGDDYYFGDGVAQDYVKAVEWYTKAADQGDSDAQNMLGVCYYNGNGVEKDYAKAVEWYTKAAKQGYVWAQNNLGDCYYNGNGVEKNYAKAAEWYTKAAEQGYDWAQYNIGKCYQNGEGVMKDFTKAVEWYTKAAEQGFDWAQYNLGNCYYNGNGVTANRDKAIDWYIKAADQGNTEAKRALNNIPGFCLS